MTSPAPDAAQPAVVSAPVPAAAAVAAPTLPERPVTKRRVTMRSAVMGSDGAVHTHEAVDFVRPDFLEAYLADVKAKWQFVEVSDEPDAGPAGYHGSTYIPAGLDHPRAHTFFPATDCVDCDHAPAGATVVKES